MPSQETTRLLCASGLLSRQFRSKIFEHLKDSNRACSPEIGVDLALVAQVCQFATDREREYLWFFLLIAVLGIAAIFVNPLIALIFFVLASVALHLWRSSQERTFVRKYFQRHTFDPVQVREAFPAALESEFQESIPRQDQNLIVYQGFTPFIGAGINLGGWSFSIDIDKPTCDELGNPKQNRILTFTPGEFYDAIDSKVYASKLGPITIDDCCFVNGAEIRNDRVILPNIYGKPIQRLDDALVAMCKSSSDRRVRHYQWIRIHDWDNELIISYFLRSAIRGNSLFVEINRFVLTPLFTAYRQADRIAEFDFMDHIVAMTQSLIAGPAYAALSGPLLLSRLGNWIQRLLDSERRKRHREIDSNPLYNYGAASSIRYTCSSTNYSHYFQSLDSEFYRKVLEHQILDGVVEFLEEHNIDTSEIRERRTMILNNGVIVQSGGLITESLAVGTGATAIKSQNATTQKKV